MNSKSTRPEFIDKTWVSNAGQTMLRLGDILGRLKGLIDLDKRTSEVVLDQLLDETMKALEEDTAYQTSEACISMRSDYINALNLISLAANSHLNGDKVNGDLSFSKADQFIGSFGTGLQMFNNPVVSSILGHKIVNSRLI